jgi:hypothetical protein
MSTQIARDNDGKVVAYLTFIDAYKYQGFYFSFHNYMGVVKLKKNLDPAKREGAKFWNAFEKWDTLTIKQKEATKIFG